MHGMRIYLLGDSRVPMSGSDVSEMTSSSTAKARIAVVALAATGAVALYLIDPARHMLMPKCVCKLITGLDCPACGLQRAAHALLHGRVAEAFGHNLFLPVSLPYMLGVIATKWFTRGIWHDRLARVVYDRRVIYSYVVLFLIWGIARNLLHI